MSSPTPNSPTPNSPTQPLALVQLLRTHGLDALTPLFIKARRHPQFPNLICFKYEQRLSPMHETAVQDARALILDEADDWRVVSMSYRKFFNLGEPLEGELDWSSARIEEKLDGSLLVLYPYAGAWQVQSSGLPDAGGSLSARTLPPGVSTFADLFWHTFAALGYALPPLPGSTSPRYSLSFELMTPHNEVVVHHTRSRLVLHAVRNLETLVEEDAARWAVRLGYEAVRTYDLDREGLRAAANALSATEQEGFIVRDAAFRRVKVKGEQYVRLSHVKDQWTPERAGQIVLRGETEEFSAYFPGYAAELAAIQRRLEVRLRDIGGEYERLSGIADQKTFAAQAMQTGYSATLFAWRSGKVDSPLSWLLAQTEPAQGRALRQWGVIPEEWGEGGLV
ncbi:RNA ligase [Deinococcus sp.]|uniref:RNA ligase n=1 Tax=Deinococcus sp. TaxID=47478 RepID=UPI0025F0F5A2|nr:RNA ligase [Deinococcus sp.]